MLWLDVDGARDYLAGGRDPRPSRKAVYNMVKAGLRVSRGGESGRRLRFCAQWIDEFLIARSSVTGSAECESEPSLPRIVRSR